MWSFLLQREDYKITIAIKLKLPVRQITLDSNNEIKSRIGIDKLQTIFLVDLRKEKYKTMIENYERKQKMQRETFTDRLFSTSLKLEACIGVLTRQNKLRDSMAVWIGSIYEVVRKNSAHFLPRLSLPRISYSRHMWIFGILLREPAALCNNKLTIVNSYQLTIKRPMKNLDQKPASNLVKNV